MAEAPMRKEPPSRRAAAPGFQNRSEASMHAPAVAAKPRAIAHEPISLSANPCAPAAAGNRMAAVDQSNDRVARRSSMTILLKDDPGAGTFRRPRWRRRGQIAVSGSNTSVEGL